MRAYEFKLELESKRNNPDLHEAAKKNFQAAIEDDIMKFCSCSKDRKISFNELIKLLPFEAIITTEKGYFYEFINTNSGPSPTEDSYSEIYYLMHGKQTSSLHSLTTTETWRWVGGSAVVLYVFKEDKVEVITLDAKNREYTIEKSASERPTWFGAKNVNQADESFSLVTCECKPGFRMEHYKDPTPEELDCLSKRFSAFSCIITELMPLF